MRGAATSGVIDEEIADGDRLGAVGARAAGSDPTAAGVAIRAGLLAEGARLAGRALGDGGRAWRARSEGEDRSDRLTGSPGGLTAGIRAEASATDRAEAMSADRAGDRSAVGT